MVYFHIKHFFKEQDKDAKELFEKISADLNLKEKKSEFYLRHAVKDEFWIALDDRTTNTVTLIADLPDELEDFFTIIEYDDDAQDFSFDFSSDMRRFKLEFRKEDEKKFSKLVGNLELFSNSNFLIKTFYDRFITAFDGIVDLDGKLSEKYGWRVPEDFGEEFLSDLESLLDDCGMYYSKMESNYHLAKIQLKNIGTFVKGIKKNYDVNIKVDQFQKTIDEMEGKVATSKVIYKRISNMKDITVGKESVRLQKYAITIQHATIVIEAFIVYAYTFYIWVHVNPGGFAKAPLLLKYVVPMLIAAGVVLFVESLSLQLHSDFARTTSVWFYLLNL